MNLPQVGLIRAVFHESPWIESMHEHLPAGTLVVIRAVENGGEFHEYYVIQNTPDATENDYWRVRPQSIELLGEL